MSLPFGRLTHPGDINGYHQQPPTCCVNVGLAVQLTGLIPPLC
ncbi:hypothetical protein SAMN05216516_105176 [Izhakiella capsodis]|uniref:Uncharacterized protein n=1 Tax=Izhakiella capsodis TaxID=1367852 RepID=A0A1I4Y310_9GAMM|nr:hypothetical protein [Izhakiella capsodis]SFN32452.1 hypothetical protein SAMN05216516_105176 [Izhakiella capsodis]